MLALNSCDMAVITELNFQGKPANSIQEGIISNYLYKQNEELQ